MSILRNAFCVYTISVQDNRFNSLTDAALELIDPTPNIHTLFVQFNAQFFWNTLDSVEVKWSNRMTSCAGICTFYPRNKQCVITLSAPLLKLRPRKDLVETLLHEMIHAFLFLTNNDHDRNGHGPVFCLHMRRINIEAGTNITIYHNFHNEVKLYQQHWWKCNGPCQYRPPFFGTVRRAMNRPPNRSDFWWADHQRNCNGQFIKIKEPENYKSKKNDKSKLSLKENEKLKLEREITEWFSKTLPTVTPRSTVNHSSKIFSQPNNDNDKPSTSKGNNGTNSSHTMNNLYAQNLVNSMGKFVPKTHSDVRDVHDSSKRVKENAKSNTAPKSPKFSYSGVLGGSRSGQSNLLTKFQHLNNSSNNLQESASTSSSESPPPCVTNRSTNNSSPNQQGSYVVFCPVCDMPISLENIYKHIDTCLVNDNSSLIDEINNNIDNNNTFEFIIPRLSGRASSEQENNEPDSYSNKRRRVNESHDVEHVSCPVCNNMFTPVDINQHLDECLERNDRIREIDIPSTSQTADNININSSYNSELDDSTENSDSQPCTSTPTRKSDAEDSKQKCLVCNTILVAEVSLNDHLEECIGNVFNDTTVVNDDGNDDDVIFVKDDSMENKYPCPVCMQIIAENLMNQHLDMCLKD